ncbi:CBL-interacting protein kinase 12 [Symbiodinium microadriaticum]|uniref:CBL-interacting protein kinase 12 n=1 Tax=Symbiodinium microadriaticum TaxID=2951 RepID=A0A1Q9DQ84_SYMMI|nr:CBL-interacting protein kinase 12 [Symbiodinium microadriaticum]
MGLERVIKIVTTKNLAPRLLDNMRREIQEKLSGGDLDDLLERNGLAWRGRKMVSRSPETVKVKGLKERPLKEAEVQREPLEIFKDVAEGQGTKGETLKGSLAWLTGCCLSPQLKEGSYNCKIIDFGLSATFDPTDPGGGITDVNGTPAYMAPEVCKRYAAKADVWSIGVLTYELLTGSLPFGDASDYSGGFKELFELLF